MKILEKIKQVRCSHKNVYYYLGSVELYNKLELGIKVTCVDCGKPGWAFFEFQEIEWK